MSYDAGVRICPETGETVRVHYSWDENPNHRTMYVLCRKEQFCPYAHKHSCEFHANPNWKYIVGDKRNHE